MLHTKRIGLFLFYRERFGVHHVILNGSLQAVFVDVCGNNLAGFNRLTTCGCTEEKEGC